MREGAIRFSRFVAAIALMVCAPQAALAQVFQLNENCTVSVLNRNVRVNADGSWLLPNVPANFGAVRARATCIIDSLTVSGESAPFTVPPNGVVNIPPIIFGLTTPIPTAVTIAASTPTLTEIGATVQLVVTARYPDGSVGDVTAGSSGTQYTISNPAIATISEDGLVQAVKSGTVLVQATQEGASGITSIRVALGGADTDGDGIPDDIELALGLNPNNPVDGMEDFDRDGLSNLQESQVGSDLRRADTDGDGLKDGDEVARGTAPLLRDTDGDGISDGLEVQTGSNPLLATSYNLSAALSGIAVTPPAFTLTFNTIAGDVFVALKVTGALRDGTSIDLTSTLRGTNYNTSDVAVCSFGGADGRVFAGDTGTCTITVSVGGFSLPVPGTVHTFSPTPLSSVGLAGQGNGVDVSGEFAYVAVGGSGLQVVRVTNRNAPQIVATLALLGIANDVKLAGTRAYVAAGAAGLHVVDISNPLLPRLLASVDTPGDATDVRVRGDLAFVADGSAGLQIIDLTTARIIGSTATAGTANGVDVTDTLAVVAVGPAGIQIVNITNPAGPVIVGAVDTPGDAQDVVVNGNFAYVADYTGSLRVVDFNAPAAPALVGTTPPALGGILYDVTISPPFVFGADIFFVNGVPVIDISTPTNPIPREIIRFPGDSTGLGVAVDGSFVYLVGSDGRLYIGQYRIQEDLNGIPPTVSIGSPVDGATFIEGETIPVWVLASDDLAVIGVTLLVDGASVATDTSAPYQFNVAAPLGATTAVLGALAGDLGNNTGAAVSVVINVTRDPMTTTAVGRVLKQNGTPVAGANVTCLGQSGVTLADGSFSVPGVRTVQPAITCSAGFVDAGVILGGVSAGAAPVRGGTTEIGDIVIAPVPVISSITPTLIDGRRPPSFLQVTGANLAGSTFSFVPVLVPPQLTVGTPQINAEGTVATLPINVFSAARGQFVLAAANSAGTSDPSPSSGNTLTVINDQDEADVDHDGFPDGVELVFGSNPFDAGDVPNLTSHGEVMSAALTPANSAPELATDRNTVIEVDRDRDGFADGLETVFGSDPFDASSVPNLTSRGEVMSPAFSPGNSAPELATDRNIVNEADRDRDGFPDGLETLFGSDPFDASSVPNLTSQGEVMSAALTPGNSAQALATDRNTLSEADRDGDGFPDGLETMFESNPFDAASVPVLTSQGELLSPAVVLVNTALTFSVAQELIGSVVSVVNTALPSSTAQELLGPAVSVSNTSTAGVTQVAVGPAVSIQNSALPVSAPVQLPLSQSAAAASPGGPNAAGLSISLAEPRNGDILIEGQTMTLRAVVSSAQGVRWVEFIINGQSLGVDSTSPYESTLTIPAGVNSLTFGATVTDVAGNGAITSPVDVGVQSDPTTTITGRVVDAVGNPVAGAVVDLLSEGLQAEFFEFTTALGTLPDLTGLTPQRATRVTAIGSRNPNGVFGPDPLGSRLTPDYAARFSGWISIPVAGTYGFVLGTHDGGRLTLAGVTVVNLAAGTGQFREGSAVVSLPAGLVPIEVTHYEGAGSAELQLSVVPPGGERQVVAPSWLVPGWQPFVTTTDASGAFTFRNVPTVLTAVQVRATVTQNDQTMSALSNRVVPLAAGATVDDIVIIRP